MIFDKELVAILNIENLKYHKGYENNMETDMIKIPRKAYEELLEEVGILRNPEMMDAINEGIEAKKKGVKSWEIDF